MTHKYFDIEQIGINPKRKAEDPVPQPVLKVELGPPSVREANFSFAAKLNDFQQVRTTSISREAAVDGILMFGEKSPGDGRNSRSMTAILASPSCVTRRVPVTSGR